MAEDWNIIECLYALETYRIMDIKQNELHEDYVKNDLYKDMFQKMNQASGRKRTQKALEFKLQNVSAIDPRAQRLHPISAKGNYQQLLDDLYHVYMDQDGKLTKKIQIDLELLQQGQYPKYLPINRFEGELSEIGI